MVCPAGEKAIAPLAILQFLKSFNSFTCNHIKISAKNFSNEKRRIGAVVEGMSFASWALDGSLTIEYETLRGTLEKVPYAGLTIVLLWSGQ